MVRRNKLPVASTKPAGATAAAARDRAKENAMKSIKKSALCARCCGLGARGSPPLKAHVRGRPRPFRTARSI